MSQLDTLVRLFHADPVELARFEKIEAAAMPEVQRGLLDHRQHMTVTVERHHGGPVDVDVLAVQLTPRHYAREILLRRQRDRAVVQYGIMRIEWSAVPDAVCREIEAQREPLGRILIRHAVLTQVEPLQLWRVLPGAKLQAWFELRTAQPVYGRTATIHVEGRPAVELLEIVNG